MEKLLALSKAFRRLGSQPSVIPQTGVRAPERYLDVVSDEEPPEVEHLQHGGRVVVRDAVALQDVPRPRDLPGEPAQVEGGVAGQQAGRVARLAAAAAPVVLVAFHDGLHLPLLAVGPWGSTGRRGVTCEARG